MKSIFKALYNNHEIRVENTWFSGERLYINNELQDETISFFPPVRLTGHILENGEKIPVKANIYSGFVSIQCSLFINDKKVKIHKIR